MPLPAAGGTPGGRNPAHPSHPQVGDAARAPASASGDGARSGAGQNRAGYAAGKSPRRTRIGHHHQAPRPAGHRPGADRRAREAPRGQPPDEIARGLFGLERRLTRTHPLASDALLAAVLLGLCSAWLSWSTWAWVIGAAIVQTALIAVLIVRRLHPSGGLPGHQRYRVRPVAARLPAAGGRRAAGRPVHRRGPRVPEPRPARHRAARSRRGHGGGQVAAGRYGATLAAFPDRHGGGRAVRRADGGLGQQVPGLDGRTCPAGSRRSGTSRR